MKRSEQGFTLIELLVAMAVFSFMLLIVVVGFINVVTLRDQALASDLAQDNARTAMNEVVRAVRDSADVTVPSVATSYTSNTLCLSKVGSGQSFYKVVGNILMRYDTCVAPFANPQAITNTAVKVVDFTATQQTYGPGITKPEIELSVTVASNNSTTMLTGPSTVCKNTNQARTFCSKVTITSGAVPR